jgi:hypothetical protein
VPGCFNVRAYAVSGMAGARQACFSLMSILLHGSRGLSLAFVAGSAGLALPGCSDEEAQVRPPANGSASVVLGTGETQYAPLEGEPVMPLIPGFQGGFHVFTAFLAYGFAAERLDMHVVTSWGPDDAWRFPTNARIKVRPVVDDLGNNALMAYGWPAQVTNAPCAQDQRIRVDIIVNDEAGLSASDTCYFIAEVPAQLRASDCP